MKKLFLMLSVSFTLNVIAVAQVDDNDFIYSIDPQLSIPLGNLKETNSIGLGGSIHIGWPLVEKIRLRASFGGGIFQGRSYETDYVSEKYAAIAFAQLKAGIQYFVTGGLFCSGQIGIGHTFQKGYSAIGFVYAPMIGYEFGNNRYYDIAVKYDVTNIKTANSKSINAIGITIGYHL